MTTIKNLTKNPWGLSFSNFWGTTKVLWGMFLREIREETISKSLKLIRLELVFE